MKKLTFLLSILLAVTQTSYGQSKSKGEEYADDTIEGSASGNDMAYFGLRPPGMKPEVFAEHLISKPDRHEFGSVFSKDGKAFFWGIDTGGKAEIWFSKLSNGVWTSQEAVLSHPDYSFNDPMLSPNEDRLYFISDMPLNGAGENEDISKILWTANWSKDGKYIAVGGVDKKIRIYDGQSFELLKALDNNSEILRMSWHPYSNLLAIAADNDGSKLIDIENDSVIQLKGDKGYGSRSVAWNHSGELLANADYEGEISIWTMHGELIRTIKKDNTVSNVAIDWHPSKNEFIVLSELVRIYDSEGNLLKQFEHREEKVLMLCVKWHKSGKYFVLGDYGDNYHNYKPLLQFWKADASLLSASDLSKAEYRNMSWTKNGRKLATASDALRIWSKRGKLIAEGPSEGNLWGVDWSPDGKFVVTSSENGLIKLWDKNAKFIRELRY